MKNRKITEAKNVLKKAKSTIDKFNIIEHNGNIIVSKTGSHSKFLIQTFDDQGCAIKKYIPKGDKRVVEFATKRYYRKLSPIIDAELKALEKQEKDYWPNKKYEVYEELGELKEFVKPLFIDDRQKTKEEIDKKVKDWVRNNSFPEEFMEEGKKFLTSSGNKTRSKSEWMIIALLDRYSEYLKYVYEPELYIPGKGLMRPDFEMISVKTGKVYFWEHIGMLGDEGYASKFVEKINAYAMGGYFPGKNLLLSFESATQPLNLGALEQMLNEYFVEV